MLNPIPFILIFAAIVGLVVLILNHLPELRQVSIEQHKQPSWVNKGGFRYLLSSAFMAMVSFVKSIFHAVASAKVETRGSRDVARHISDSVRQKLYRRRTLAEQGNLEIDESIRQEIERAEQLFVAGNQAEAEDVAIGLLRKDPQLKIAYEFLGKLYLAQKNWPEAAEVFRFLVKQSPGNAKYWASLGDILSRLEDYETAVKAYMKSLEIAPRPEVSLSMGLAYQALDNYGAAGRAFESALDLEPENTQVLTLLAENYIHREENESAEHVLEQILEIEPNNHVARERLMQLKA